MIRTVSDEGRTTERTFTVRVPEQTYQALSERASAEQRSMAGHVRWLIERDALKHETAPAAQAA